LVAVKRRSGEAKRERAKERRRAKGVGTKPGRRKIDLDRSPGNDWKHCDDYIDDPTQPEPLRKFLDRARMPAHGMLIADEYPKLFATHEGKRVRVVMASRFGDVGITQDMTAEVGYQQRVIVAELTEFAEVP
jgi:hypothetical protein